MLLILSLIAVCFAVVSLHAELVGNQGSLDDLLELNQQRYDRINQLQAEIAHLDSPEGLAEQADLAGLVPAAELVVLTPVGLDRLPPPGADPFALQSSGWTPTATAETTTPDPTATAETTTPDPTAAAPESDHGGQSPTGTAAGDSEHGKSTG